MRGSIFVINGAVLIVLSIIMGIISTRAYGNNLVPTTTPEALNDLILALFLLTGSTFIVVGRTINNWHKRPF